MKVLNPTVSVVLASHMKPEYLPSALDSVLQQTRLDIQVIVVDSGEWHDQPYDHMVNVCARYSQHPLVEWYSLGEPPYLRDRKCPYAYIWNIALRELVRGKYISFFTDDDLYKPEFIEMMAGFLDANPDQGAVFSAQDRLSVFSDGSIQEAVGITADVSRSTFDNHIDMLQMMVSKEVLAVIGDPWFNEDPDPASCRHADGQFMDRVGQIVGEVANIPMVLSTHRYTPVSTYN